MNYEKLYAEYFIKLITSNKCNIFLIRGRRGIGKECTDVKNDAERKAREGGDDVGEEVRDELEQVKNSH